MVLERTVRQEVPIDWEKIYQRVDKDYHDWVQHNIDANVNPLNHSFDYSNYDIEELFDINVDHYFEEYMTDIPEPMYDPICKEFAEYAETYHPERNIKE